MHTDRNVNMVKSVNLNIKESEKYGQCRFRQRCNFSHDLKGRCKREEEHGWCQYVKFFLWTP